MFNLPATFITSSTRIEDCPDEALPEFCFAGRSNVGKSSLINALVNRKNLARTSNTPGKTQQMNYYKLGDEAFLVDLPGYGFAKVPKKERDRWGESIKKYLTKRETLRLVLQVVDSRHPPTSLDEEMFYWMASEQLPFAILLSKSDKLSGNKLQQSKARLKRILKEMNMEVPIIAYSADSKMGIEDIQQLIRDFV